MAAELALDAPARGGEEDDEVVAVAQEREGMAMANGRRAAGQRNVDRTLRRPRLCGALQTRVESCFDVLLERVGELPEAGTFVG